MERYEKIPDELKELKHWCGFRLVWDEDKQKHTKVPINAETGRLAKSNDETTWTDFDKAVEGIETFNFDGIGFFFKEPYIGIDIDGIREQIDRYLHDDKE